MADNAHCTTIKKPTVLRAGGLRLEYDPAASTLTLWDHGRRERLVLSATLDWLRPTLNGQAVTWRCTGVAGQGDAIRVNFAAAGLKQARLHIRARRGFIELQSEFVATGACELNRLEIAPVDTGLNFYDVVNFRNRHFTPHTWPELNLGGDDCSTDTYSGDWQFAPHPTMVVFRKDNLHLFYGALDLPKAFGMYLSVQKNRVRHWYVDYGPVGCGQSLQAGEKFVSPRFCLFIDRGRDVYQTIDRYTRLLTGEKLLPQPRRKKRHAWHTEPLYCTWGDQVYGSKVSMPAELNQQESAAFTATAILSEQFVRRALAVIQREKLPFRTILLDEGWEVTRGQWDPHPQRFPDLRRLVDDIHAAGMKVIVWWNWAELFDDAQAVTEHLIGGGKRNRHGRRMRDYSHPKTQKEYLEPLFYRLFSSDSGCYDLDGVKTDFQADKVHPDMPPYDPQWRGEENYIYRVHELFYRLMRRFKPDACHIGCAGHPWLAEFIDVNRTYDVHGSDVREHTQRAQMLRATAPLCPVAFDMTGFAEALPEYFAAARQAGAAVQVGNLLFMRQDVLAPPQPVGAAYYRLLRRELKYVD